MSRYARIYRRPDGTVTHGILFDTIDALQPDSPAFHGRCHGYQHLGIAVRVFGGWWQPKGIMKS